MDVVWVNMGLDERHAIEGIGKSINRIADAFFEIAKEMKRANDIACQELKHKT